MNCSDTPPISLSPKKLDYIIIVPWSLPLWYYSYDHFTFYTTQSDTTYFLRRPRSNCPCCSSYKGTLEPQAGRFEGSKITLLLFNKNLNNMTSFSIRQSDITYFLRQSRSNAILQLLSSLNASEQKHKNTVHESNALGRRPPHHCLSGNTIMTVSFLTQSFFFETIQNTYLRPSRIIALSWVLIT